MLISAYIFFSRRFSSSRALIWLIIDASIPPYLEPAICKIRPCSSRAPGIARELEHHPSAWRRMRQYLRFPKSARLHHNRLDQKNRENSPFEARCLAGDYLTSCPINRSRPLRRIERSTGELPSPTTSSPSYPVFWLACPFIFNKATIIGPSENSPRSVRRVRSRR